MNIRIGFWLLCLMSLVACKGKTSGVQDTLFSGVIRVAVDETLSPLAEESINVFEAQYNQAGVIPLYMSEVEAINLLLRDSVRWVLATRPLTENELESFHSRKFFPESVKVATDGIALIVNRQNADSIFNVSTLRKVFSGKITRWDELTPASRAGEIQVVFDHPNSSTVRYVIDSICGQEKLSDRCHAAGTNRKVIDYVAHTPGALGVIGVNWISDERDSLCRDFLREVQVARVSRADRPTYGNSYQPYQYYLYTGQYPLRRDIYILLNDPRSVLPSGLTSFFTGSRGQRIILKTGLLPATMPVNIVNVRDQI
ncbi:MULTISPECIES: PstS family phosphate ABC transporter substrate-binding protein [Butyricimonas]|uniref:PstS family phosphate ABC transporter substrate-binding protein n=1 Tax=Butyricimonas TaxID=574697 RepID=UPI0007FB2143|nr:MULTISPECIES: substrate-binding domain-containing protein [Butyricimonas]